MGKSASFAKFATNLLQNFALTATTIIIIIISPMGEEKSKAKIKTRGVNGNRPELDQTRLKVESV